MPKESKGRYLAVSSQIVSVDRIAQSATDHRITLACGHTQILNLGLHANGSYIRLDARTMWACQECEAIAEASLGPIAYQGELPPPYGQEGL